MKKQILSLMLAIVMICTISIMAYAHPVPELTKNDCFINVVLQNSETAQGITDAQLSCVKVAGVNSDDGNFDFYHVLTAEKITDLESPETAQLLYNEVLENRDKFEAYTSQNIDEDGTYSFGNLKLGLYLIIQEKAAANYNDISPFLVAVPHLKDGEYVYNVTADVKTELYKTSDKKAPENEPQKPSEPQKLPIKLPQTGQLSWPIPVLAASGLLLVLLGCWIRFGALRK